jgi:hypothetical protein
MGRLLRIALIVVLGLAAVACGISTFDQPQGQVSVSPDGAFTASEMTRSEAESLVAKQVTQLSPVLFPAYLTDGATTCAASGARDTFNVQCSGGAIIVELATQAENPQEYKPMVLRRVMFRSDPAAVFMDVDPAHLDAVRMMLWSEAGTSPDRACGCVQYELHIMGISQTEFFKIANSLHGAKQHG